ncbi:MAG: hypothetical protein JWO82_816 [Akkermansiaceae bacterium]|nr:hypothetical protein [Akkermansiaceae bacterium]
MKTVVRTAAALIALATPLLSQQAAPAGQRSSGAGLAVLPSNLKAPGSRVITDAELTALRSARNGGQDPKPLPPKKHGFSLVEMSTILAFGEQSTLLPKGSIISCPDALKARIVTTPSGTVVPWQEFLAANRNWIVTTEVELKQVRGEMPLPQAELQTLKSRGLVAIATLNGCPVTVLPYSPANLSK